MPDPSIPGNESYQRQRPYKFSRKKKKTELKCTIMWRQECNALGGKNKTQYKGGKRIKKWWRLIFQIESSGRLFREGDIWPEIEMKGRIESSWSVPGLLQKPQMGQSGWGRVNRRERHSRWVQRHSLSRRARSGMRLRGIRVQAPDSECLLAFPSLWSLSSKPLPGLQLTTWSG